ncbi:MAG: multidrug ABC transporter ATP-binding protein [Flavobacteriaceae bacterium]|nr:multidrug ABC transporter ATP-binding protein [Flavobacteriaceae bacterium]CAI8309413.1 MAG: Macrolide export ATP-binding/permease protein MacB [Flavobacteriales bacterium]|tara:strand:- start:3754 stop:5028 length:1275 start_codon:yes stop_codon:yes gene_type:complete
MNSLKKIFEKDTWDEIFESISKNRTRTIITTIGVFWGIFIYLALAGSAKGLENGFDEAFSGLSKNSMGIWAQSTEIPYKGFEEGRRPIFQLSDVDYIKDRIPEIQYISPGLQQGAFSGSPPLVVRGLKSDNFNLFGNFPDQANISVIKIYEGGRYINDEDIKYKRKVAVIGEGTQERLFDQGEDPLGEYIRINDINFKVVGVEKFTEGSGFGSDSDITIPYTTFAKIFNRGDKFGFMFISGYDYVNPNYLEETIIDNLKVKKIVHPDDDRAFGSFNIGSLFESIIKFTRGMVFLSLVVGIATIFAGVIGIGNIMLIAVKERTNELGIRRALGATPGEVKVQIVLESVFLTILAGIVGIIVGAFLLFIINIGTSGIEEFPFTNPTVPLTIVFGAFVIMVTLGTLIGLIPAERAVSIKPIEALREE